MSDVIWDVVPDLAESSAMAQFARQAGIDPFDYDHLHRWSISDLEGFWSKLWDFAGIIGDKGDQAFRADPADRMMGSEFFPDAKLNLAENLLRRTGDEIVLVGRDEAGGREELSADQLRAEVARVADGLRAAGIGKGDRVGVVLPNRIESMVTLLASAAIGAVWTSCSPDFGKAAIIDRIGQVRPKLIFAQPRYRYGGRDHDISDRIGEIAAEIPGLETLVLVGDGDVQSSVTSVGYEAFGKPDAPLEFTRLGFSDPAYVLYTSGTTGAPKAIVHRTGGVLLNQLKEHILHNDVRPGDRFMWYSNNAWMMYHWSAAILATEARLVIFDGAPMVKQDGVLDGSLLWNVVEEEGLTHLGVSPKYLSTLADISYHPAESNDLSSLRWMMSSGSPMAPWQFDWVRDEVRPMAGHVSLSGGTDLMGCFVTGAPTRPIRRGALTARTLGMATNVLDDRGAPVVGRPGELVCTEPFPSQPLTFWGENGDARYRDAYFAERPGIWTHGDHAEINPDGSMVIHGRSDFTLNPQGVRIGTADIYNICDRFAEIADAVVFGRPIPGDEEIVLCLVPAEGQALTADLAKRLRVTLRDECSPRHVPAAIYQVTDVPYTINAKRVEGAAKAMATGGEVKNKASLANPKCLEQFACLEGAF